MWIHMEILDTRHKKGTDNKYKVLVEIWSLAFLE